MSTLITNGCYILLPFAGASRPTRI